MARKALFATTLVLVAFLAPAPALPQAAYNWTNCGFEGGRCMVIGEAIVRYGVGDRWVTRTVHRGIDCSNQAFGSDPAPGARKLCQWRPANAARPLGLNNPPQPLAVPPRAACAQEGGRCQFSGFRMVIYGVPGRLTRRQGFNGMDCTNLAFGRDPAPTIRKSCWLE